jgi:transcriptional regulator with XRE-family HTH domain
MVTDDQKRAFSDRLNEALDDIGFPAKGAGRQGALGERMGVSQKGARKWLEGEAIPATSRIIDLAQWLNVNFEWLAMARGAKKGAPAAESATQPTEKSSDSAQGTSFAPSKVTTALAKILREIDGQHRLAAITDDDATLLRAALHAVQTDMSPTIRAAILLMLGAQNSREEGKNASNPPFKAAVTASHSTSDKVADSPAAFARSARADLRSAAEPESDEQHDTGKHGT